MYTPFCILSVSDIYANLALKLEYTPLLLREITIIIIFVIHTMYYIRVGTSECEGPIHVCCDEAESVLS